MDLNNTDEQMNLFQEGGIADDGMSRDPISGNEVPSGSLASEVRDDVDAKLSEGEYVVPADVVRYFGVGYFEKLREKAKKALSEMDADGRIGGEPLEEDEEDFPFSDDELMSIDEGEEAPVGMAEGGSVTSSFNPQLFQPGFSTQGSGVQTKTFINKEGQQRAIIFVNGQPIQQIPAGFVEATAENRAEFTKQQSPSIIPTGEVKTEFSGEADGSGGGPDGSGADVNGGLSGTTGVGIGKDIGTPEGGYGKMGTAGTVGLGALTGLAFGGIKGAIAGGREGKDIADFNDARNALAEAVQSNDLSAIAKSSKDVEDTFAELGKVGKLATNTLGMSAKDAVNAVGYGAQGAGTSSRGDFGYGLSEAEQAAAAPDASGKGGSYGDMAPSHAGYVDPYSEGFGPGGVNRGGGDTGGEGFGVGTQGAADVDAAVAEAMGNDGGGGGGDGGKVICTALNFLGLLPDDIYKLDQEFGRLADLHDPALTKGYRRWATPVAEYIKKDTLLSKAARYAIKPLANAWAKEMAHQIDPANYNGSITGKLIMAIGHPICRKLGKG